MQTGRLPPAFSSPLIANSCKDLCSPKAKTHAIVDLTAQNGKVSDSEPAVANSCRGGRAEKKQRRGERIQTASRRRRPARLPRRPRRAQPGLGLHLPKQGSKQGFAQSSASSQPPSCAATLAALSGQVPTATLHEAAVADVGSLRSEGKRGSLICRGVPKGTVYAISVAKEAGAWKVASLAGTPLN